MLNDPKRWVWTADGAAEMNEQVGKFVWDNYQANIPLRWVEQGLVREATPEDGVPGQIDLLDVI